MFCSFLDCWDGEIIVEGIIGEVKWGFCYLAKAFVLEDLCFINVG